MEGFFPLNRSGPAKFRMYYVRIAHGNNGMHATFESCVILACPTMAGYDICCKGFVNCAVLRY